MNKKLIKVGDLDEDFDFWHDSDEIEAIKTWIKDVGDFDNFFVLTKNGEVIKVYGHHGSVPWLSDTIERIDLK